MEELLGRWVTTSHTLELVEKWHLLPVVLRWAGIGFLLIFLEINLHRWHLISIWFAFASFSAALVGWILPSALALQVFVFLAVAGIGFYYRPFVLKAYIGTHDRFPPPPDRLLGKEARCIQAIGSRGRVGTVAIAGHQWPAAEPCGDPVGQGETVRVIGRDGMTLLVEVDNETEGAVSNANLLKIVGRGATWLGTNPETVAFGQTSWPAKPWPPGTRVSPRQPVSVIGVSRQTLLVQPASDLAKEPNELVGRVGVCTLPIDGHHTPGTVQIDGVYWQARADGPRRIPVGDAVKIVEVDGASVIVDSLV